MYVIQIHSVDGPGYCRSSRFMYLGGAPQRTEYKCSGTLPFSILVVATVRSAFSGDSCPVQLPVKGL